MRGIVVTGGFELSPGLLQIARANDVTVIVSPHDTATTTMRIKSAREIAPAIEREFVSLSAKQPIEEARHQISRTTQAIFPVLDDAGALMGVLSKSDLVNPPKPRLVLVDHNELGQAVDGAEGAEILGSFGSSPLGRQPAFLAADPVHYGTGRIDLYLGRAAVPRAGRQTHRWHGAVHGLGDHFGHALSAALRRPRKSIIKRFSGWRRFVRPTCKTLPKNSSKPAPPCGSAKPSV